MYFKRIGLAKKKKASAFICKVKHCWHANKSCFFSAWWTT